MYQRNYEEANSASERIVATTPFQTDSDYDSYRKQDERANKIEIITVLVAALIGLVGFGLVLAVVIGR